MLGRHIYRVHPEAGRWTVTKEGEAEPRGEFASREEALTGFGPSPSGAAGFFMSVSSSRGILGG